MDNGASSYRRFLEGDDNGIVEIIRDYKDGLIFFLNRYLPLTRAYKNMTMNGLSTLRKTPLPTKTGAVFLYIFWTP